MFLCVLKDITQRADNRDYAQNLPSQLHTLLTQSPCLSEQTNNNNKTTHPTYVSLPLDFYLFPFIPQTASGAPKGVGFLSAVLVTAHSDGTRDRLAQPCVWLLSMVLQSTELCHRRRQLRDTSLFPELGRLLLS